MAHPDQHTPDDHRSSTDQSPPEAEASRKLPDDLDDPALENAADTGVDVRTPDLTEERQGEAGNAYVGRAMDDDLKANPRIEDADRVTDED